MSVPGGDPYEVLGLEYGASDEAVQTSFRTLAAIYHPDRYANSAPAVREAAEAKMRAINDARATIVAGWQPDGMAAPVAPAAAATVGASRGKAAAASPPSREKTNPLIVGAIAAVVLLILGMLGVALTGNGASEPSPPPPGIPSLRPVSNLGTTICSGFMRPTCADDAADVAGIPIAWVESRSQFAGQGAMAAGPGFASQTVNTPNLQLAIRSGSAVAPSEVFEPAKGKKATLHYPGGFTAVMRWRQFNTDYEINLVAINATNAQLKDLLTELRPYLQTAVPPRSPEAAP